jgi:hypothetical protein
MLHTSEPNMAETVKASDIDIFLSDAAWAMHSIYHTVPKASPGAAIVGQDMLFDILFIADWQKIGEHRQLGWQCWDLCLLAPPLKQQTFLSVANMSTMSARHVGNILLCRPIFRLLTSCQ